MDMKGPSYFDQGTDKDKENGDAEDELEAATEKIELPSLQRQDTPTPEKSASDSADSKDSLEEDDDDDLERDEDTKE